VAEPRWGWREKRLGVRWSRLLPKSGDAVGTNGDLNCANVLQGMLRLKCS
jgi:hypothetical protein